MPDDFGFVLATMILQKRDPRLLAEAIAWDIPRI